MRNSNLVIMTPAKAKPGKEQDVHRALRDVAKAARTQSGCVEYRSFRSAENAAVTVNFERWSSKEERDAFLAGPDVKKFVAAITGAFVESPQPVSYQEID
jgi:quinol monooxygenase YgiN